MSDLRIVQLTDERNNPITPYTAAASVYVNVNGEWTNVETLVGSLFGGIDLDAIKHALEEAVMAIEAARDSSLAIIEEQSEFEKNDIEALSGSVQMLEAKAYPLEISIADNTNYEEMKHEYHYDVNEYYEDVSGATITVTYKKNDGPEETIYTGSEPNKTIETDMSYGINEISVKSVKGYKESELSDKTYLCLYGTYNSNINADILKDYSIMKRISTKSVEFQCSVSTTSEKQYIWIAVPEPLSITSIDEKYAELTLWPTPTYISVDGVDYKAYRSLNALQPFNWNLVIK